MDGVRKREIHGARERERKEKGKREKGKGNERGA